MRIEIQLGDENPSDYYVGVEAVKRIEWIDFLRAIAIIFVILCHATEGIYMLNLEHFFTYHPVERLFAFTAFTFGRLGVPLFLMITGYLLLDRNFDEPQIISFWKNQCLRLFTCTEIWFLLYDLFLKFFFKRDISIFVFIQDMLFIHKIEMGHVWYMPMILGFYVLIPFTANTLKKVKVELLLFPMMLYGLMAFGFPLLSIINDVYRNEPLSLLFSAGFSGGAYGLYLICGYLIKHKVFRSIKTSILIFVGITFFCIAVAFQLWAYHHHFQYNIWYDSLFLLISTVSFFELVSRMNRIPYYHFFRWISYYSFAIYLIHYMFRMILVEFLSELSLIRPVKVCIVWLLSGLMSLLVSWMISKAPRLGKILLYLK